MLTGVTGLPGACKTLWTLSRLIKLYQKQDRQIYVHNIDGIDHEYFGTLPLDDPEKWFDLPAGAVIIMDEAQGVFPLRKAGSYVPEKCSKFETHRHDGHDVILITQDATLLDVHLRKLMGKHFHCKRLFGSTTSTIFEYNKFEPKPEDPNTIKKAISSEAYSFDKSVYDKYHSSEVHTVKRKLPKKLIVVPFVLVLAVVIGMYAFSAVASLFDKEDFDSTDYIDQGEGVTNTTTSVPFDPVKKWVYMNKPAVDGLPWTAPLYDAVQDVVSYPKPHCIIYGADTLNIGTCQCYSQQITKMDVNDYICRSLVTDGWFDHTKEDDRGSRSGQETRPVAASPDQTARPTMQQQITARYAGYVD